MPYVYLYIFIASPQVKDDWQSANDTNNFKTTVNVFIVFVR